MRSAALLRPERDRGNAERIDKDVKQDAGVDAPGLAAQIPEAQAECGGSERQPEEAMADAEQCGRDQDRRPPARSVRAG